MGFIIHTARMSASTHSHLCGVEFFSVADAFMFLTSSHQCFPVRLTCAIDGIRIQVYAFPGTPAVTDVSADGRVKLSYHVGTKSYQIVGGVKAHQVYDG
jgi:hypothetical protein